MTTMTPTIETLDEEEIAINYDVDELPMLRVLIKKSDQEPRVCEYLDGIEPSDTVLSAKKKIEEKHGISVDRQYLQMRLGAPELDNELLVTDCYDINYEKGWFLRVLPPQGMPTIKTFDGKEIAIHYDDFDGVNPDPSMLSLMKKIEEKEGIPVDEQGLVHVYNGNKKWVDHTSSFRRNRIGKGSQLVCLQKAPLGTVMQITIKLDQGWIKKEFTLDVEPQETISSLKEKIQEKEGIDSMDQRLEYNDRRMSDYDDMMVRDCWIVTGCTLFLEDCGALVRCRKDNSIPARKKKFARTYEILRTLRYRQGRKDVGNAIRAKTSAILRKLRSRRERKDLGRDVSIGASRIRIQKDLNRDEVIIENTTSASTFIILSYQPFEIRFAAKLLGGVTAGAANTNLEVKCEKVVNEAQPQKFTLGPEGRDKIFVERGTKKLYYTVIVSNGNTARVPRENMLWPLPKYSRRFLPLTEHGGNLLEISENDVKGGFEIDLKLHGTESPRGWGLLSFFR